MRKRPCPFCHELQLWGRDEDLLPPGPGCARLPVAGGGGDRGTSSRSRPGTASAAEKPVRRSRRQVPAQAGDPAGSKDLPARLLGVPHPNGVEAGCGSIFLFSASYTKNTKDQQKTKLSVPSTSQK